MTGRQVLGRLGWLLLAGLLLSVAVPVGHLALTWVRDERDPGRVQIGYAEDISRLEAVPVREIWPVPGTGREAEQQLSALLARARAEQLPVAIAGARHSMGGHSLTPDGIVIDMRPFRAMHLSPDGQILTVQAGALWSEVIAFLDPRGRSVSVMQSDSAFSVGGSLSVNVHGWQSRHPPIASSVRAFRLMLADGQILRCSRTEQPELFSLVLGGYGLFGIILDVELQTVANAWYQVERVAVPAAQFAELLRRRIVEESPIELAYGRLAITGDAALDDGVLTLYRSLERPEPLPEAVEDRSLEPLKRLIFRGSAGSDYGKALRWDLERWLGESIGHAFQSRNQLLNSDPAFYLNHSPAWTDILQEYFIPPSQLPGFLANAKRILRDHQADLLNLTLRDVRQDSDTFLRYATEDQIAVVMFFNQARTQAAEARMRELTQALIDASLASGGRYYLPYRPHASLQQFLQAYPQARRFAELKRHYDPDERFQNQFYRRYLRPLLSGSEP